MTLDLTDDEVNTVLIGLGELPLKDSVAVWLKIKRQAQSQMQQPKQPQQEGQLCAKG